MGFDALRLVPCILLCKQFLTLKFCFRFGMAPTMPARQTNQLCDPERLALYFDAAAVAIVVVRGRVEARADPDGAEPAVRESHRGRPAPRAPHHRQGGLPARRGSLRLCRSNRRGN